MDAVSGFWPALPRLLNDRARGAYVFLALACLLTWQLSAPMAFVTWSGASAPPIVLAFAALSAFGPSLAALTIAGARRELSEVFGRWRVHPKWIVIALVAMPALHLPATLIEVALGGQPAQWFYPPVRPEHVAALVLFSIGEEFGWRGFALPRLSERHGAVAAALIVGLTWSAWHYFMWFTADGPPALSAFAFNTLHLTLASVIIAWMFQASGRSMTVAIALHASGHLDNVFRAPDGELRLKLLRMAVLAIAAFFAARALSRAQAAAPGSTR